MIDTSLLKKEEKSTICKILTGKFFKELFIQKEKDFSKIKGGFRAKSLTYELALSTAINNFDKEFIVMSINKTLTLCLNKIQSNFENLEKEGLTSDIALATAILDSPFKNNIDLYFKLSERYLDKETYYKFINTIEKVKYERQIDTIVENRIKEIKAKNDNLSQQIEIAQQNLDELKANYEQKIIDIEQEKTNLVQLLTQAKEKIIELTTIPTSTENNDTYYIEQFDDTNSNLLPSFNSEEIISLCSISTDYNGNKLLIRQADLSYDGKYHIFQKDESLPPFFRNREKLFYKDGPSTDGFYGVWNWHTEPNKNDPSKYFIKSCFNKSLSAIEVVKIADAKNIDELVNLIKKGIEYQSHSNKVIFCFYTSTGQYIGILCSSKDIKTNNGITTFVEDCTIIPVYEFTNHDIIYLDNGLLFYRNAFAGVPIKLYHLKTKLEIVRNIVSSAISWNTYKTKGLIRADYKTFKDFIGAIPVNNITFQIATTCHCSTPVAKELLDKFIETMYKYIDDNTLEDEIIRIAISKNIELQDKTKELIRADWETENQEKLNEAHEKLTSIYSEVQTAKNNLSELQNTFNKLKSDEEHLSCMIAEKEKLAEDVEKSIANRIKKAQENVADFIATMAFINGQKAQDPLSNASSADKPSTKIISNQYHTFSESTNINELEEHHSWIDVINTAAFELGEAGVADKYRNSLATFLCAAYIEKQPIFLIGPNAIDIINAFSAAISAHKYGILCCDGKYSNNIIKEIGNNGEKIVIINNLLASGWLNRLPEILSKKDIFYIATHPYSEDIQVEPKSLYGFMLPLFTEFFVDKKATGEYYGGYFADDFQYVPTSKNITKDLKILSKFTLSFLVKNRLNALISTMYSISSEITSDDEFLFAVLPITYASLDIDELKEAISNSQTGINISANLKRDLKSILGDF